MSTSFGLPFDPAGPRQVIYQLDLDSGALDELKGLTPEEILKLNALEPELAEQISRWLVLCLRLGGQTKEAAERLSPLLERFQQILGQIREQTEPPHP
jgi:uncharacterized alpha-E superfamily protein